MDKNSLMPRLANRRRARGIALVAFCAVGQAICAGVAAFATRDVFFALREPGALPVAALVAIILSSFGIAIMRIGERVLAEKLGQDYAAELRQDLFNHLTRIPTRAISGRRIGGLALRFVGDLSAIRGWLASGLTRLISAAIVLPSAALVLFLLSPLLAAAAVGPILLGLAAMAVIGNRLTPVHRLLRSRRARLASDMSERIPVAAELRLLGRMGLENANLKKRTAQLVETAVQRAKSAAALRAIPDIASGTAAAALLYAALVTGISAPTVAGAMAALGLMIHPMRSLAGVWDRHRAWIAAREKCEQLLAIPRHAMVERSDDVDTAQGIALEFQDVSAGRLQNLNIILDPGKKVAVIGGNGAGKSTLLMLAAGLDKPERGQVLIGGKAPSGLSVEERVKFIGLMGKGSPILAGSLRRALTMGVAGRPKDTKILAAAHRFGLAEVIDRLGGLDGKVAEAGRNLSSGEIRRLLLARLSLGQSSIVLLDEPDDALDADGAALIMELCDRPGGSAIVITHNIALARQFEEIWVIDNGQLIARGTPATILAPGSTWAHRMGESRAA